LSVEFLLGEHPSISKVGQLCQLIGDAKKECRGLERRRAGAAQSYLAFDAGRKRLSITVRR
jgi:hypothetical protein